MANATVAWTVSTPSGMDGSVGAAKTTTGPDGTSSNTVLVASPLVLSSFSNQYLQATVTASALGASATFTETNAGRDPNSSITLVLTNLIYPTPGTVLTGTGGSIATDPIHITVGLFNGGLVKGVDLRVVSDPSLPGTAACVSASGQPENSVLTDVNGSALCYVKFGNIVGQGQIRIYVGGQYDTYGPINIQVQTAVPVPPNPVNPRLSVSTSTVSFQYPGGGPLTQTVAVTSSGGTVNYTASSTGIFSTSSWLKIGTPSGPASSGSSSGFPVTVTPQALAAGIYYGTVAVHPDNGTADVTVNVILTVGGTVTTNLLTVLPGTLNFSQVKGSAPSPAQTITVGSSGAALAFTALAPGTNWLTLSAASGTTPAQTVVTVDGSGLQPGNYTAQINFVSPGAINSPQSVTVNLTVIQGQGQSLSLSSASPFNFTSQSGAPITPAQNVAVTASSGSLPFTATASVSSPPGGAWLTITPSGGMASGTPTVLTISVNPQGLNPGTYNGSISVASAYAANGPQTLSVVYTVENGAVTVAKVLPQFAFGGGWHSALYFTNTSNTAVSFPVGFVGDDGKPLSVPGVGGSSTILSLAPRGTAVIESSDVGTLQQGYASFSLPAGVVGYGIFRQSTPGRSDQEAVVPFSGASATTSNLIWDDTNFITGVAIVNLSSVDNTVTVVVRDGMGGIIGASPVPIAAKSKLAVALRDLPGLGGVAGNRGSAEFTVSFGNVAVLGLRFGGAAFTSIPTADK